MTVDTASLTTSTDRGMTKVLYSYVPSFDLLCSASIVAATEKNNNAMQLDIRVLNEYAWVRAAVWLPIKSGSTGLDAVSGMLFFHLGKFVRVTNRHELRCLTCRDDDTINDMQGCRFPRSQFFYRRWRVTFLVVCDAYMYRSICMSTYLTFVPLQIKLAFERTRPKRNG